jgi:hypothetical protein
MGLVNLFECWNDKMFTCVRFGPAISKFVKLQAGVRQSGVPSPHLLAVFIDDMLKLLAKSTLG